MVQWDPWLRLVRWLLCHPAFLWALLVQDCQRRHLVRGYLSILGCPVDLDSLDVPVDQGIQSCLSPLWHPGHLTVHLVQVNLLDLVIRYLPEIPAFLFHPEAQSFRRGPVSRWHRQDRVLRTTLLDPWVLSDPLVH